jgi:hypothetical protein
MQPNLKPMENIYFKVNTNKSTNFEGHNLHLRLLANRNIKLENECKEEER